MPRRFSSALVLVSLTAAVLMGRGLLGQAPARDSAAAVAVPKFRVDPSWPALPNQWVLGDVAQVAVDNRDHVWLIHRPHTVPAERQTHAAPPVIEFDANGKFVRSWGGDSETYEWPSTEHGITVDYKGNIWIGGSNPTAPPILRPESDDMLLKFTNDGKFLMQIGKRGKSGGNADTKNFMRPTEVFVYPKANEAFVSDGYGNRRLIVIDADTGAFKRMWGAFGNVPLDPPRPAPPAAGSPASKPVLDDGTPGPQQFGSVHGVKVSNDDLVYVEDRNNRRIQIFSPDGKYLKQVFINRAGPGTMSAVAIAFSPDKEQRFMYVGDYGNSEILVLDRQSLKVLDRFGSRSAKAGDFQGLHHIAVDSKGNLYTTEVAPGQRAQKFTFVGLSTAASQ